MTMEDAWYSQLREQWKPPRIRVLLIAESAPDDGGNPSQRRFFYADHLGADNLFRSVVDALYGVTKHDLKAKGKRPWLERLRDDGVFLIDLAARPVNAGLSPAARAQVLRQSVAGCVERARALNPAVVVVIKSNLYPMLAPALREAGLRVPQQRGIPFPLGNTRAEFAEMFKAVIDSEAR